MPCESRPSVDAAPQESERLQRSLVGNAPDRAARRPEAFVFPCSRESEVRLSVAHDQAWHRPASAVRPRHIDPLATPHSGGAPLADDLRSKPPQNCTDLEPQS